jgi:iron complex outermembrane receptor protein
MNTKNTGLALLLTAPLSVWAEEATDLDTVVVSAKQDSWFEESGATALKMSADQLDTPFSQNVINAAMLEDLKASTLESAYGYLPSFSRSGTAANSFTIRGMSADLQNIQVDGLPGLVSRFGAPVTANVDRMEVLKGPASVLYGWMEPGGLVNIITKKPEAQEHGSVDLSYQHYSEQNKGGYQGSLDYTGALTNSENVLYRVIAGGEKVNSFRDYVDTETVYFYPSVAYVWDASRLDVQLEYTREDRDADAGLAVLDQDIETAESVETYYQEPGDFERDEGYALSAAYVHTLTDTSELNIKWRSVLHEDERDLYENNRVNDDGTLRRRNRHQLNRRGYHFLDANLKLGFDGFIPNDLLVGVNGGYEYRQYDRIAFDSRGANIDIANPVYTGDVLDDDPNSFRRWKLYNAGAYVFDRAYLTEQLTLVAGVRYDQQKGDYRLFYRDDDNTQREATTTSSTNYSGGLAYALTEQLSLYSSYAESFDPQTVATYDANGDQLDPQQGEQYEAGAKLAALSGRLNIQVAWFDITKKNVVETNDGEKELIGEITSKGAELSVQYQVTDELQVQTGYAWVDAEVSKTLNEEALGNKPAFAPVHSASLWARYNYPSMIWDGFVGASLGARYESERYTDEEADKRVQLPAYRVMDLGLYYERMSSKYALNIGNLTNEEYYVGGKDDIQIRPGEPLKITLSVQWDI